MNMAKLGGFVTLAIGLFAGCGAPPDDAVDDGVVQTTASLTSGVFTLHNYQTDFCLGVQAGNPNWGTHFVVWECDTSANQNFQQLTGSFLPAGFIGLKNFVKGNTCLNVDDYPAGVGGNGEKEITLSCPDANYAAWYQEWKAVPAGTDFAKHECYQFVSAGGPDPANGKDFVLGVQGGSTSHGTSVMIWDNFQDRFNHPDQYWCVY